MAQPARPPAGYPSHNGAGQQPYSNGERGAGVGGGAAAEARPGWGGRRGRPRPAGRGCEGRGESGLLPVGARRGGRRPRGRCVRPRVAPPGAVSLWTELYMWHRRYRRGGAKGGDRDGLHLPEGFYLVIRLKPMPSCSACCDLGKS